jgi:type I restriction-modification system DNA methylase subunit
MKSTLSNFQTLPLKEAARQLLEKLGYKSDKFIAGAGSSPKSFLDLFGSGHAFDQSKALFSEWKTADLLFQLTDEELSRQSSLFTDNSVQAGLLKSYVFIAIELKGGDYARGKFSSIARQINRLFPMPVMVFFRHQNRLTIAVINRRQNKLDESKDVLGKVTLISGIDLARPHRGHIDILVSLALSNLVHPQKKPISDFDTLHNAWEQIFNVELLNERFYKELSSWYHWALPQVEFPADLEKDEEKRNATGLIRLLTRVIFCWFLKEKNLIPEKLFNPTDLDAILKGFDPESQNSSTYYQAILQNLFFATLNQRMSKDAKGRPYRAFAKDEGFPKNKATYDVNNLYRYESLFCESPEDALLHFADIPFLNGGLFECLDRTEEGTNKKLYLDGFSRTAKKRAKVPDRLFFGSGETVDLSDVYGDKKRKAEHVTGLIQILNRYKFTIAENTPIDQEIALDPELLGKVFENLLASYNEETKTNARKQTGSFYTPRPIVDYMVDESLKAHLRRVLVDKARMKEPDACTGLDLLFAYTEKQHPFSRVEVATLITAIDEVKILDPACGSGAFPMGALHKLVYILSKLDPDNERWKETQLAKLDSAPMRESLEATFADNNDDYGRKLYLIENCLYGVDIQPIAIQITKLRFFISLICDQKTNRSKKENLGIRPLPNLETKFVAADSLVGLPELEQLTIAPKRVYDIEREIEALYHSHFSEQRRDRKLANQGKIKNLRRELATVLAESLMAPKKAQHIADWDPFNPQAVADFLDPHWMFGRSLKDGFDIVIGNPPYISVERFAGTFIQTLWHQKFETYAARGDVYCFFYERGADLLRKGGNLTFITSNKWMRTGYGERLREFLSFKVNTETVLDFGMAQNFGAATTYTCITRYVQEEPDGKVMSCYATDDRAAVSDPGGYFAENAEPQKNFGVNPWIVISAVRQRIKKLVEAQGIALEKWDIQINYGIKTGFNDAFYLNAEQRNALIAEDAASDELISRLLRGRDVERYAVNWNETYQLVIKFGAHEYLEERYPAVFRHLEQFEKQLKERGQCKYGRERKNKNADKKYPGQHHWLELDNNPSDDNLRLFAAPKIMYPNMTKFLPFYFDNGGGYLTNDKGFIINSETQSLCYLTAFLNSHLFRCCFRDNFPELMGNTYEVRKIFIDKIPIKKPTAAEVSLFERLVPLIQFAKADVGASSVAATFLEDLIDACVMECYFREHMADRDLLFHDTVSPHLAACNVTASQAKQRDFITHFHTTLNAPRHPIRNRLLRLTADSPDLLAVIKAEGRV